MGLDRARSQNAFSCISDHYKSNFAQWLVVDFCSRQESLRRSSHKCYGNSCVHRALVLDKSLFSILSTTHELVIREYLYKKLSYHYNSAHDHVQTFRLNTTVEIIAQKWHANVVIDFIHYKWSSKGHSRSTVNRPLRSFYPRPETTLIFTQKIEMTLKVAQGHCWWPSSYATYHFLLVVSTKCASILHRFGDINTCLANVTARDIE